MKKILFYLIFLASIVKVYAQPTGIALGSFSGTFCAGQNTSVDYSSTGGGTANYNTNNAFYVELSNATGTYSNPSLNIGTLLGTARAATVLLSLPSSLPSGTGYVIRIVSSTPGLTSASSAPFTINAAPSVALSPVASVCTGTSSLDVNYTAASGSPNTYSIVWNAAALSAGLTNVTNAALPASKITITGLSSVAVGEYTGSVFVTNSITGCSRDVTTESVCAVAAENGTASFATASGLTFSSVKFASYGNGTGSCGNFVKGSCDASNSISVLQTACLGRTSCTVGANNGTFPDPCVGVIKHLLVELQVATFRIVVSPLAATIVASRSTICSGEYTTLTATAGESYLWNTGATTQSITVNPASTTTYTCTVTNLGCTTSMASSSITVNASPSAVLATSSPTVCTTTGTYNLALSSVQNSPNQYSVDWGDNVSAMSDIAFTALTNNTVSITGLTSTAGTYPATIYLRNTTTGCVGNVTGDVQCGSVPEGATLTMTAPGANNFISVAYASFGTPTGACGSFANGSCHYSNSAAVVRSSAYNNNSFSITAHSSVFSPDPCSSTLKTLAVQAVHSSFALTVSAGTVPTITNPGSPSSCAGATSSIALTTGGTTTSISWTNSNTGIGLGASGTDNSSAFTIPATTFTAINSGTTPITATITATPINATCVGATISFTYTVNPLPTVVSNQTTSTCSGTAFSVTPTNIAGTTYDWTAPTGSNFTGGSLQTGQASISQTLTNTGTAPTTATYTVTPKYGACSASSTFSLIVSVDKIITTTYSTTGANTYSVPVGITSLIVEVWGGGGAGGAGTGTNGAGGGGSAGAYAKSTLTVIPSTSYNYFVGAGGAGGGGAGGAGTTSWFGSNTTLLANRGQGGPTGGSGIGRAATTNGNIGGTVNFYGGGGGNGAAGGLSGGGGSSAGTASNGNSASGSTPGATVTGGGAGATGVTAAVGATGGTPGGGGSGGRASVGTRNGGSGGVGQVRITIVPAIAYTASAFCKSVTTASPTIYGGYTVGTFSSTAGLSLNASTGVINPSTSTAGTYTVTFTSLCGLLGTPTTVTITELPTANAGTNIFTCSNSSAVTITAGASASNTTGITWSSNGSGTFANANDLTTATYTPSAPDITLGSVTITLTAAPNSPCSAASSSNKTLSITPAPTVSAGTPVSTCSNGGAANITAGASGGNNAGLTWSTLDGTGTFANNTSLTLATYNPTTADGTAGSRTLVLTATGNAGCANATSNKTLTVNSPPVITLQPANLSKCAGESGTFSVAATGTAPLTYQWKKAGSDISGAISTTFTIPSVSTSDVASYTVSVSGSCSAPILSSIATLSISTDNVWQGGLSRDWFTPGNWGCGSVPSRVLSAVIPTASQYPIISTSGTARTNHISIASTASLTISNNAILEVYGNWSNAGVLSTNNATVSFKGVQSQSISNNSSTAVEKFYNLTIGKYAGTVTVSSATTIDILANGTLKIDSGSLDLNSRRFVLRSAAPYTYGIHTVDSTARLGRIVGTLINTSGFAIERYIPTLPYNGFNLVKTRFIATPIQGVTARQWADSVSIMGGAVVDGFVQSPSWGNQNSTLLYYNEPSTAGNSNARFRSIMTQSTALNVGQGYALSLGYDAQASQTKYPAPRNYVILKMAGHPTVGSFSTNITKSGATLYGYNLVGNPYPCEIDWNSLWTANSSVVSSTMAILDPLGGITSGQHFYYNARTGKSIDPRYSIDSVSFLTTNRLNPSYISSSQAFFVLARNLGTSSLLFQESVKPLSNFRAVANFREDISTINIGITNGQLHDNTYLFFHEEAALANYDPDFDSYKLANTGLNISTNTFGNDLAMNGLSFTDLINIPIKISASAIGKFKLVIQGSSLPPSIGDLFLRDKYTGITKALSLDSLLIYSFDVTSDPASKGSRFLLFKPSVVTDTDIQFAGGGVSLYPNPVTSDMVVATISNPKSSTYTVEILDVNGVVIYQKNEVKVEQGNKLMIDALSEHLSAGVYMIKMISETEVFTKKLIFRK